MCWKSSVGRVWGPGAHQLRSHNICLHFSPLLFTPTHPIAHLLHRHARASVRGPLVHLYHCIWCAPAAPPSPPATRQVLASCQEEGRTRRRHGGGVGMAPTQAGMHLCSSLWVIVSWPCLCPPAQFGGPSHREACVWRGASVQIVCPRQACSSGCVHLI